MRSFIATVLPVVLLACGSNAEAPEAPAAEAPAVAADAPAEAAGRDDAKWKYFGETFSVATAKPAAEVLGAPEAHADGPVRFTGELAEVCQKMGCWAVVRDDEGHSVRITMKDHAFGIDKDAMGKACDVEGTLVAKKVDPKQLEHYAEEGATEHPEAGKDVAWSLVASSVAIARD
jgi:hypothetical protein